MKICRTNDMVPVPKNSLSKTQRAFNNEIFELLSWYKIIWMVYRRLDELIRLLDKNFLSRLKSMYRLEREGITRWGKVMLKITEKELWNTSIFLEGVSTLNECNEK